MLYSLIILINYNLQISAIQSSKIGPVHLQKCNSQINEIKQVNFTQILQIQS